MSKEREFEYRWERKPVWLTRDADKPDGFMLLVPVPGENDVWLVHGVPVEVRWKRWHNMGERAYTPGGEYLGWFYKPSKHLRTRAFSKVHPQVQEVMYENAEDPWSCE